MCRPASFGCATAVVRRGAIDQTIRPHPPWMTWPCWTPPARAYFTMTVIEATAPLNLTQTIGRFRLDPLAYVMYAFPWGRAGTALADESGPEPWQREVLQKLG